MVVTGAAVAVGTRVAATERTCLRCSLRFTPRRKDQVYCSKPCAKAATRNKSRGSRHFENRKRTSFHYDRAARLAFDLYRMSADERRAMILAILESASGAEAPLRNILLDPALLKARRSSSIGKIYPDSKYSGSLNVAQMVNRFCLAEWGCDLRDAILDDGKPAGRLFIEPNAA